MKVFFLVLALAALSGCASNEYRFDRVDGNELTSLPLKFDGLYGVRDGASVEAEMTFSDGADRARVNLLIALVPPAEFRSGAYQMTIGGKTTEGAVECASLNYLGGQAAQPSVGGVFILKDAANKPAYRITVPATLLTRKPPV